MNEKEHRAWSVCRVTVDQLVTPLLVSLRAVGIRQVGGQRG
jgi:hypothetical protein